MNENDPARKGIVYETPASGAVLTRTGIAYGRPGGTALTMDLYRPPGAEGDRLPAVIVVAGFPDPGYERVLGCKFKDTGFATSWARLLAATGIAAVTYTNEEPVRDAEALLDFVAERDEALGIEASRLGLLASSGNVPLGLSLAWSGTPGVRCAALYYGFFPDDAGSARLAAAAAQWRFANPFEGTTIGSLRPDVPLLVARAGCDEIPAVNATIDPFVSLALGTNLPVTLVNHPEGAHAFDLHHDSARSRAVIRQTVAFFDIHLGSEIRSASSSR